MSPSPAPKSPAQLLLEAAKRAADARNASIAAAQAIAQERLAAQQAQEPKQ